MITLNIGQTEYPVLIGTSTFRNLMEAAAKAAAALPEGHEARTRIETLFAEQLGHTTSVVEYNVSEAVEQMNPDLLNSLGLTEAEETALGAHAVEEFARNYPNNWEAFGAQASTVLQEEIDRRAQAERPRS